MAGSIGSGLNVPVSMDVSGVQAGVDQWTAQIKQMEQSAARTAPSLQSLTDTMEAIASTMKSATSNIELMSLKMLTLQTAAKNSRRGVSDIIAGMSAAGARQASEVPTAAGQFMAAFQYNESQKVLQQEQQQRDAINRERLTQQQQYLQQEIKADADARRDQMDGLRRDIEERSALMRQRQQFHLQALQQEIADDERARREQMAALRQDIEERAALERQKQQFAVQMTQQEIADDERARREQNDRLRKDLEERSAAEAEAEADRQERARRRRDVARRLDEKDYVQQNQSTQNQVTQSIQRRVQGEQAAADAAARGAIAHERSRAMMDAMAAELDPMVGLQTRLTNQVEDYRSNLQLAVATNRITQAQATTLLNTYEDMTQQVLRRARTENTGFLGNRRFGFAMQQFGFAIEDAASVWGQMGAAGAFRAAGNNLTAMAAVAGPLAGVFASISSAVIAIGINVFNASQKMKDQRSVAEQLEDAHSTINDTLRERIELERDLADTSEKSFDQMVTNARERLHQLKIAQAEMAAAQQKAMFAAQQQQLEGMSGVLWGNRITRLRQNAPLVDIGARGLTATRETLSGSLRLFRNFVFETDKYEDAQDRITGQMRVQQLLQKQLLADMKQRVALHQQLQSRQMAADLAGRQVREALTPAALRDASRIQQEMVDNADALVRLQLTEVRNNAESERITAEIVERQQKRVQLAQELAEVRRRVAEIDRDIRSGITQRFEAINPDLRFANEQVKARQELNKLIEEGLRLKAIDQQQAEKFRGELERILELEREKRDGEERLDELEKRRDKLKQQLKDGMNLPSVGVARAGSAEAYRTLAADRNRMLTKDATSPVVNELKKILQEIKEQKEVLKQIEQEAPEVANF